MSRQCPLIGLLQFPVRLDRVHQHGVLLEEKLFDARLADGRTVGIPRRDPTFIAVDDVKLNMRVLAGQDQRREDSYHH